jgi:DNA mismatch repair protein MSH2
MAEPPEIVDEGNQIVKELLRTWATRTAGFDEDEDDEIMLDGELDKKTEKQIEELRRCFDQFKPRIEGNAWCKSLFSALC